MKRRVFMVGTLGLCGSAALAQGSPATGAQTGRNQGYSGGGIRGSAIDPPDGWLVTPAEAVEFVSSNDPAEVGRWLNQARLGFVFREANLVSEVAWPMKFGEYLASGAPVVITACGWDLEDVVARHHAGVVVDWDAPAEQTAEAILDYLHVIGDTRPVGVAQAAAELDSEVWVHRLAYRLGAAARGSKAGPAKASSPW